MSRRRTCLLVLLALPIVAHVGLTAAQSSRSSADPFRLLDHVVLGSLLAYLVVGLALWRGGRWIVPFLAVVYVSLLAATGAELWLRSRHPLPPRLVPLEPMYLRSRAISPEIMPGLAGAGELAYREFSVNSLGLRGPEVDLHDMDLRILCVGGGPVQSMFSTDRRTWPWLLQEILAERPGNRVFVGNAGCMGHTCLNHADMLRHYEPASRFDWALIQSGWCDLRLVLADNYEEWSRRVSAETLQVNPQRRKWDGLPYYRRTQLAHMIEHWWSEGSPRPWTGAVPHPPELLVEQDVSHHADYQDLTKRGLAESPIRRMPKDFGVLVDRYRRELRDAIHAARERGLKVAVVNQPYLFHENMPPEPKGMLAHGTPQGAYEPEIVARCLAEFNRATEEVCRNERIPCIDVDSQVPRTAEFFFEGVSPNNAGMERIARAIASSLIGHIDP